jgi:small subunit ribosomal protein S13
MARISGVNIPDNKRIEVALTYVYGIGPSTSKKILTETKIDPNTRTKDLSEADVSKLREYIDRSLTVEGDLQRTVAQAIGRLREVNAYRGVRHKANLPVHGQRTKTNARTKRGKKVTMGSGRKKAAAKT